MSMIRPMHRRARIALAFAAILVAASFAACRTAPFSPAEDIADAQAYGAVPPSADFHAVLRPGLLPALSAEYLAGMAPADAARARDLLRRTRTAYIAFNAPAEGRKGPFYALLSGRYPASMLRSALAGSKDVVKKGDWYILSGGIAVSVPSDRFVLATNADTSTFLKRYALPATRAERGSGEAHPISAMLAREGGNPVPPGLRLRCASPASLARSPALAPIADIPLSRVEIEADEDGKDVLMSLRFTFDSDDAARIFLPAARTIGLAMLKASGLGAGSAKASRAGNEDVIEGIRLPVEGAAALMGRLLGTAR